MKTKLFAFIALMLLPLGASAIDVEIGGIHYILDKSAKTASVTYTGDEWYGSDYVGDIVIPDAITYDGTNYSVTAIGNKAFYISSSLTYISIPNSVTSIGDMAFYNCSSLTSIVIPNSVTSIGKGAFRKCSRLTSVVIPNSVTSIGSIAFYECSRLTSVSIGNSVTSIGEGAFEGCTGLKDVYALRTSPAEYGAGGSCFDDVPTSTCTLHVPAGCKEDYANRAPWSYFENIVEDAPTGVQAPSTLNGQRSMIYDLLGRRAVQPARGIYVEDGRKLMR